jgi:basic membrane lipoprotein Med (substrate-binding protein (PBP1-ABC) superfamily)
MKSRIGLALVMVLAIFLSACGGATSTPEAVATEAVASEPFRVAVIMPSAINDLAFSQSMFDALTLVQTEMGGEDSLAFVYTDNAFVVDDAASAIRDYASQGYDLIIAHGSQYGASLQEIAPDFPETSFAWGTAGDTFGLPNVFAYEAYSQEGGYVNGVIAAAISEAGVVGVVGPIEVGDAKLYVDGFKAGAEATKPGIQVNVNYIGSFGDVALASEAAQTHADAGADAMTGSAQMVVGAVGVAKERGIAWFGTQSNQTSLAPEVVVASQVYHWEVVLRDIISKINAGTLGGEAYAVSLANGGEVVEFNEAYTLPADVKTLAEETIQGIKDGSLKTGVGGR